MNRKPKAQRAFILQHLIERSGVNATVRLGLASKNTILKLVQDAGVACMGFHNRHMINLPCRYVQVDEMWSYVYAKKKNVHELMPIYAGDQWLWLAICAETKLLVTWHIGERNNRVAEAFMEDIAYRHKGRVQITSDGYRGYVKAILNNFKKGKMDYRMLVKPNNQDEEKDTEPTIIGNPNNLYAHNSYVERHNLTVRTSISRFVRKTNGHSKKLENHIHHIALYVVYYNFCRVHETLRTTPAIAAGLTDRVMTLEDVIELTDEYGLDKKLVKKE